MTSRGPRAQLRSGGPFRPGGPSLPPGAVQAPGTQLSCAHCPASPQAYLPLLALRAGPLGPIARGARQPLRGRTPSEERGTSDDQRLRRSRSASHLLACGKNGTSDDQRLRRSRSASHLLACGKNGTSDNQRLRRSRSASHLLACGKKGLEVKAPKSAKPGAFSSSSVAVVVGLVGPVLGDA